MKSYLKRSWKRILRNTIIAVLIPLAIQGCGMLYFDNFVRSYASDEEIVKALNKKAAAYSMVFECTKPPLPERLSDDYVQEPFYLENFVLIFDVGGRKLTPLTEIYVKDTSELTGFYPNFYCEKKHLYLSCKRLLGNRKR